MDSPAFTFIIAIISITAGFNAALIALYLFLLHTAASMESVRYSTARKARTRASRAPGGFPRHR